MLCITDTKRQLRIHFSSHVITVKGKAIPVQAWTGREVPGG